jgi:hypothetical protein
MLRQPRLLPLSCLPVFPLTAPVALRIGGEYPR